MNILRNTALKRSSVFTKRSFHTSFPIRFPSTQKIEDIVESISTLNLIETSKLIAQLKVNINFSSCSDNSFVISHLNDKSIQTKLNISEVVMQQASSSTQQASKSDVAPPAVVVEKTQFTVKLESFDAASKAKVIREIKQLIVGSNLVEVNLF